ncbi:MAG: hypothetical protein J3Q66DRAFT_439490 [Benniella sp.]|nr:MAG: hypothetical protein J3Q66DRAFT_439490 [Benniella sp.]
MSLIEHHNEIVRHALVKDVAIICDDPTKARLSAALLKHDALRSAKAKGQALLFVVQEDARAAEHRSCLAGFHIRSRVVSLDAVAAMTLSSWAGLLSQTQVIIASCQALLSMLKNGVLQMEEVALMLLDSCHMMMLGDDYHQLITALWTAFPRPRLVAFALSAECGLKNLLMAIPISIVTATIDSTFLSGRANQACELIRCTGPMGAAVSPDGFEATIEDIFSQLAEELRGYDFFASALKSYEYARTHLGVWCSAHIWKFFLPVLREQASTLHPSQVSSCLALLEDTEQVVRRLETSFPWPTVEGISEKLCRLVAALKSAMNGTIRPALVLVNSVSSAMVIAEFLERAWALGEDIGMRDVRVAAVDGASESSVWSRTIEDFKSGTLNILVASGMALSDLPMGSCHKVIQFDVVALENVTDLAHQLMAVRSRHPLADFLGGNVLKYMIGTDVFVANLKGGPHALTMDFRRTFRSIDNSEAGKTSLAMAYLADGPVGALRSLVRSHSQSPIVQNWVDFDAKFRRGLIKQHTVSCMTPSMADNLATIQRAIGYTFSDVRVLFSAISIGTSEYERLEFLGDAVLDLIAATHWANEHPITSRCKMTSIKSASTCNNFLGMVCMELGLHQLINTGCPITCQNIARTVHWHTAMLASNPTGDFWMEVDYPKDLADVMEAILGAVYADAVFDLSPVTSVFNKCILPFLQRHLSIETVVFASDILRRRCNHLQYDYTPGLYAHDGTQMMECTVTLGGIVLLTAMGTTDQVAKRVACRLVLERLRSDPDAFAGVCPCFAS